MSLEEKLNNKLITIPIYDIQSELNVKIQKMSNATTTPHIDINEELTRIRYWGIFYQTQKFTLLTYIAEKVEQLQELYYQNILDADENRRLRRGYLVILTLVEELNQLQPSKLTTTDLDYFKTTVSQNLLLTEGKPGRKNIINNWIENKMRELEKEVRNTAENSLDITEKNFQL